VGEITGLLDLLGALFRVFGLEESAWFPAFALMIVFFLVALPVAIVAQTRRPFSGPEGMVGQRGVAVTDLDPEGRVYVHSEYWNAVSSVPVAKGTKVVVKSVEKMVVSVEPAG
jgi:membrane-bound serine protease (ClpP class)